MSQIPEESESQNEKYDPTRKRQTDSQSEERKLKEGEQAFIEEIRHLRRDKKETFEKCLEKALHTVLLKEYEVAIDEVINIIKRNRSEKLLHERLKTKKFDKSTWHLPLTIAALKYNKYMIKCLLDQNVRISSKCKDENGDNVFHSLVRHAAKHPDEKDKITDIFSFLLHADSGAIETPPVWLIKNDQDLTVFNLATAECVLEIVNLIIEEQNEICRKEDEDETKEFLEYHDITHIDYVASKLVQSELRKNQQDDPNAQVDNAEESIRITSGGQNASDTQVDSNETNAPTMSAGPNAGSNSEVDNNKANSPIESGGKNADIKPESKLTWFCKSWRSNVGGYTDSLVELLFSESINNEQARAFLQNKTVKIVFEERLKLCSIILLTCAALHFVVMTIVTIYAIAHSNLVSYRNSTNSGSDVLQSNPNIGYMGFVISVGLVYFIVTVLAVSHKIFRPRRRKHWKHNIIYITLLLVFACCAFFHFVNEDAKTYCLIVALITGWSFMLFFLTPLKYFSFFTEMLQRVFLKNFVSFSVVFTLHLVSFSTAMYMMFKPKRPDVTFPDVLFTMFKLMIGLSEVDNIQETHTPWLSYCLYIIFVLLTYIFLLNALIAMMSESCVSLTGDAKLDQWRMQMFSVMLFFDDTLLLFFRHYIWPNRYRIENKYIIKKEIYVILNSEKMAKETEQETSTDKQQTENSDSQLPNESENLDHHSHDDTVPNDTLEPPVESENPCHHSVDDAVLSNTGENTEVYSLPRYVLTDKLGHPLATIVVHNSSDLDVPFNHNGLNIIDIKTHSPAVIILDDSEKNRSLSIYIEEYKLNVDKDKEQSNVKFYEIDERQGEEGKRVSNVLNEDNAKTINKDMENDFFIGRYVLTNKSGQRIASVYVHDSQSPCITESRTVGNVINVDTHSPGLIILDDPENGRSLNIRIKQQRIGIAQNNGSRKEEQHTNQISNVDSTNAEDSYSQSDGDADVINVHHMSILSNEAGIDSNPNEEENRGDTSENNYILIDESGCPLASVLVHGPEDKGILNDQSVCNVIDLETNSNAVILFEDREKGLRLNVQIEKGTPTNLGQK